MNWKDILNPESGGAEVLTDALASNLAENNEVFFITSSFPSALKKQIYNGYTIVRAGNTVTCILYAHALYKKLSREKKFDLIIDQAHGIPFFSILYRNHATIFTLIHEVAGELWASILPHTLGRIMDAFWLWLYKNQQFITVSNSTKQELMEHHIAEKNISIVPNFTDIRLDAVPEKAEHPTLLVLGRIAPVKRIEHAIAAYRIAKQEVPNLKLIIVGKTEAKYTNYYQAIKKNIASDSDIALICNASEEEKLMYLKQSHLLIMPSKKEGYGIAILEAAACGTPAVGYNVPGTRDAIMHHKTGLIADQETPESLAACCKKILTSAGTFNQLQQEGFSNARQKQREHTILLWDAIMKKIIQTRP